jgi:NADPH:quinone reductase-like Zn-dependent oxidoreductase
MRAFTLDSLEATPGLRELDPPVAGEGELLIRVQASSANPVDNAIAAGMLSGMVEHEFPVILGRDYAGVVEQAGPDSRFAAGDEVFGFLRHADPAVGHGSWADLVAVAETQVAAKPAGADLAVAGATPLAGITALYSVDALALEPGQRVLVVGATGGVGAFAVQLAVHAGAEVIAPALPEDHDYLRGLGVGELFERGGEPPSGVDALIDLVSYTPDDFGVYAAALKPGGRAASPLPGVGDGPGRFPIMATSAPEALGRLAALLDAGTIRVPIQHSYALAQAGDALAALASTHKQGKLAITFD